MESYHGTTIVSVRRGNVVALGGDGQVTLGNIVVKATARKIRRLHHDKVLAGFAGATADAFTLFERFEAKLEKHQGNLVRSAIELTKDWRTDRVLRRLEAMLAVADADSSLIITGNGDVLEPEYGIIAIGSGGSYAQRRGAGAAAAHRDGAQGHRQALARDRRRPVHLHQPEPHRSRPSDDEPVLAREVRDDAAGDRLRARPPHRRPGRGQAGGGDRPAQPLAPAAGRGGDARRDHAEEHPHDRPHRRRQDRDRAPPGAPRRRALHQGRGDQVHRGRLRRQGRRLDRPRPGRHGGEAGARDGDAPAARPRRRRRRGAHPRDHRPRHPRRVRPRPFALGRQHRPPGDAQAPARRRARRQGDRDRGGRGQAVDGDHGPAGHGGDDRAAARHVRQPRRRRARRRAR